MIIAQISDTHIALDTPDAERRIRDFERTIDDINALDPAPDLIIHTGDVVHNGRANEYAVAKRILDGASPPVYVMVGNKDDRGNLRNAFSSACYLAENREFISYSIGGFPVHLVILDTLNPGTNKGTFCDERVAELTEMIDAEPTKPVAVFAHHPPFEVPVGPDPLHFETVEIMQKFQSALQVSSRVIAMFCGHVHRGVCGSVGDIQIAVMPCVATSLRKGDYPPHLETRPVYHIHRYDPAYGFSTEARVVDA